MLEDVQRRGRYVSHDFERGSSEDDGAGAGTVTRGIPENEWNGHGLLCLVCVNGPQRVTLASPDLQYPKSPDGGQIRKATAESRAATV